jgi:hypothetical protein
MAGSVGNDSAREQATRRCGGTLAGHQLAGGSVSFDRGQPPPRTFFLERKWPLLALMRMLSLNRQNARKRAWSLPRKLREVRGSCVGRDASCYGVGHRHDWDDSALLHRLGVDPVVASEVQAALVGVVIRWHHFVRSIARATPIVVPIGALVWLLLL